MSNVGIFPLYKPYFATISSEGYTQSEIDFH